MKRVLIADDSKVWRSFISNVVKEHGDAFEVAEDGLEAYNKAFEFVPDIIFTDIEMPMLKGYTLCRILRNEPAFKNSGVIIMTSLNETLNKFWAEKSGASGFLMKDSSPEELRRDIIKFLENDSFKADKTFLKDSKPKPIYEINLLLEKLLLKETIKNEIYSLFRYVTDEDHILWKLSDLIFQLIPAKLIVTMILDPLKGRLFVASRENDIGVDFDEIRDTLFAVLSRPVVPMSWKMGGNAKKGSFVPNLIPFIVKNSEEVGVIGVEADNLQMEDLEIMVDIATNLSPLFEIALTYSSAVTQARIDELTKLLNYRALMEKLTENFMISKRNGTHFSIGMVDIDDFKKVNDTFGHLTGNDVLRELAATMKRSFREVDILGRYGGEEFSIGIISSDIEEAYKAMERFRRNVEKNNWSKIKPGLKITISGGVTSTSVKNYRTVVEMIEDADKALYFSKKHGKNRITKFPV